MNEEAVMKILSPIFIATVYFLIYIFLNKIMKSIAKKQQQKRKKTLTLLFNSIIKYILLIIAVVTILNQCGIDTSALITSLGLVGLAISLSLQDIVKDFIAGNFIIFENQYDVGDTIEVNGFKGEVISLGLKTTKIRAYTGEVNIISNRNIESVINYSAKNSIALVEFEVSYDVDPNVIENVLRDFCKSVSKKIPDLRGEVSYVGLMDFKSSGVKYRIIAEVAPMKYLITENIIRRELQLELKKNNIEIPYQQVVIHNA